MSTTADEWAPRDWNEPGRPDCGPLPKGMATPDLNPTWFRRRRRAVLPLCGVAAVLAVGLALASSVQRTRTAAQRMADS